MLKGKRVLFIIAIAVLVFILIYKYYLKDILDGDKYGKSANSIRAYVKVPIIGPNMKKKDDVNNTGAKWEVERIPNGLVHVWKIVSYNNGKNRLGEESDMFKKPISNEDFWQLNMTSEISGDSVSKRRGVLRQFKKEIENNVIHLDDRGLDSLFKSWQLNGLVKAVN